MLRHANGSARWNGKSRFIFHSWRKASVGSTFAARRAGSQQVRDVHAGDEQHAVDDAENRRVRTHPERQRKHSHGVEAGVL